MKGQLSPEMPAAIIAFRRALPSLRAQASAETLVVFLIFLTIFSIAAMAVSHTGSAVRFRMGEMLAQNSFDELSAKIAESCSLGPGNVRTVEFSGGNATVSSPWGELVFSMGNFNSSKSFGCKVKVLETGASGAFRVENMNGEIEISQLS